MNSTVRKISLRTKILLTAVVGAAAGMILLGFISFTSVKDITDSAQTQIAQGLLIDEQVDILSYLDLGAGRLNRILEQSRDDLLLFAHFTQETLDRKDEFQPLYAASKHVPLFTDTLLHHPEWGYSQTPLTEPTTVHVQKFLHNEDDIKPEVMKLIRRTAPLDLYMPLLFRNGSRKANMYYIGPPGAGFFRMSPVQDIGELMHKAYPEMNETSQWDFFDGIPQAFIWMHGLNPRIPGPKLVIYIPPYLDAGTGTATMSMAHPVFDDPTQKFLGAVWIDFSLDELVETALDIGKIGRGFAFIALPDGNILGTTEQGLETLGIAGNEFFDENNHMYRLLSKSSIPSVANLSFPTDTDSSVQTIDINGEQHIVALKLLTPLPTFDENKQEVYERHWILGFVMPTPAVLGPLNEAVQDMRTHSGSLLRRQSIILVLVTCGIMLILWLVLRRLTNGLAVLSQKAHSIMDGNYDTSQRIQSADELGELESVFNEMGDRLRHSFQQLEQGNLELKREIEERKRTEASLKESEERWRGLYENSSEGIILLDGQTHIQQANPTAEHILGYTADELKAMDCNALLHPDEDCDPHAIKERIVAGETIRKEMRFNKKDGELLVVDTGMKKLGPDVIQLLFRDVTERKAAESALIQTEKMITVGGLAAGMAHEINNPLGGIMQGTQNVVRRLTGDLPANRRTAEDIGLDLDKLKLYLDKRNIIGTLDGIRDSGKRAAEIISNMLDFSRSTGSKLSTGNLNDVIEKAVGLARTDYNLKKKYDIKRVEIQRYYDDSLPPVRCSAGEIQQVIINLITNAAQALSAAGTEDPNIVIRTYKKDDNAVITVTDNGPGMTDEVRRRIFEPFFTTKETYGTGLGLSVSYFIITNNHRGTVRVESEPGFGAVFTVTLPLDD